MALELVEYKRSEKILNSISHGIGAVIFLIILIYFIKNSISKLELFSYLVYSISMIIMFLNSALYHGVKKSKLQYVMRAIDHSSIFIAIAGTYTPLLLLAVKGKIVIVMLIIIWIIAISGIVLKVISFARKKVSYTEKLSLGLYLGMGWMSVVVIPFIYKTTGMKTIFFIFLGGVFYTVGVYFYRNKKIAMNHFIWHIFILLGALSNFIAIKML